MSPMYEGPDPSTKSARRGDVTARREVLDSSRRETVVTSRAMREAITVPTLTATITPFTAGALGQFFQPLAGPAGVLLSGTQGHALRVGDGWSYATSSMWGWRAATSDGFVIVDPKGGATHVDATGLRTTEGTSAGPDGMTGHAAVTWDPSRKALVLFGGALGKRALAETWEWRDGVWKRLKVKSKPAARSHAQIAWAHALGGLLMTGGFAKQQHFYDLALFRDGAWEVWEHAQFSDTYLAAALIASDEASGQIIQGYWTTEPRGLGLWRYAGHGRWEHAARVEFPTVATDLAGLWRMQSFVFAYDPATRSLVGVGHDNALQGSVISIALGPWLDTLPAIER
jgi:hypothetical protein